MVLKVRDANNEAQDEAPNDERKLNYGDSIVDRRKGLMANTMKELHKAGLPLPKRPGDGAPQLPGNVNDLHDDELGYYLSSYARWCDYGEFVVANADVRHCMAASNHEYIASRVRLEKTGTVPDKASKTHIDHRYQESLLEMETAFATLRMSKSVLSGYQKMYDALSREITRRQNLHDRRRG